MHTIFMMLDAFLLKLVNFPCKASRATGKGESERRGSERPTETARERARVRGGEGAGNKRRGWEEEGRKGGQAGEKERGRGANVHARN
jgi:hypothetical protein